MGGMASAGLTPVAADERIQLLDVVRGIALLGIFLMNVEFFARPIADLDAGLPAGAAGLDHWAGWCVHVFVRGKFWTMFSLLFGMGFAVMLGRAERAGRAFVRPYLRRTLALAAFGTLHYVFVWAGDILLSYAMGAALLMVVFHARPGVLFALAAACGLFAAVLGAATGLGHALPWQPALALGVPLLLLGLVAAGLRRWPLSGLRNIGLALYLLPCLAMAIGGAVQLGTTEQARDRAAERAATTPAAKAELAKQKRERAKRRKEHREEIAAEAEVIRQGSYADAVALRMRTFGKQAGKNAAFSLIVLGMFLLGAWFVRSGAITEPANHLRLYRRLAWFALPGGLALGLVSAAIATTHVRGQNDAAFQLASALALFGSLPASLGYVAVVVLLWQAGRRRVLATFAPAGRMALTNYLLQSLMGTWFFYAYGLAQWGLGRAWQVAFVVVVFALQVLLSRWWLSRRQYGPMEWLWRWATYGVRPRMRLAAG